MYNQALYVLCSLTTSTHLVFLAIEKIHIPLYEKHPMAKFAWTTTEGTDSVCVYLFEILIGYSCFSLHCSPVTAWFVNCMFVWYMCGRVHTILNLCHCYCVSFKDMFMQMHTLLFMGFKVFCGKELNCWVENLLS